MPPFSRTTLSALTVFSVYAHSGAATSKPGSIEQVATLRAARAAHTATALASGHVLIVGGMTAGGDAMATAELFDPTNNTLREIGALAQQRSGHTATLLANGHVLIAGGYRGTYLASAEIFDPSERRFRPAGSLMEARSGHTATLLSDGRVLFVGGVGEGWSFLRSAELFDPVSGRSETVGQMQMPRESHTATLLADGRVLVVGGHSGRRPNQQVYARAEVYWPKTRRFTNAGELITARHKHDAIKLTDGRVLVVGGADRSDRVHYNTTEIYNPRSGAFENGPSMTHRRYKIAGTSVLLPTGDVLITSGARVAELLNRDATTITQIAGRFPEAYRFAASSPLPGGDVLIAGGYSDRNENTAGVWRFRR